MFESLPPAIFHAKMVSEQSLEMISTEKVGLITHFFPVLTSYVLLSHKNNMDKYNALF